MLQNATNKKLEKALGGGETVAIRTDVNKKAQEGKMLFTSYVFPAVTNGSTVYIRHKSGPTKYMHSEVIIETVGQWNFQSYANTTFSADGTPIEILNRKSDSTYTPEVEFFHTPTITDLGIPRLNFKFGAPSSFISQTTGDFSERLESIFAPETDVLVELTNESGGTEYISVTFNFYETDTGEI